MIWIIVGTWLVGSVLTVIAMRNVFLNDGLWDGGGWPPTLFFSLFSLLALVIIVSCEGKNVFRKKKGTKMDGICRIRKRKGMKFVVSFGKEKIVSIIAHNDNIFVATEKAVYRINKKKGTKMEKVYWDEESKQIMTKDRECLYDKVGLNNQLALKRIEIESLELRINKLQTVVGTLSDIVYGRNGHETSQGAIDKLQAQLQCSAKGHEIRYNRIIKIGAQPISPFTLLPEDAQYYFVCSICGLEIAKTAKELTAGEKEALKKLKLL